MPHVVVFYTANLDGPIGQGGADIGPLCRALADALLSVRDETGAAVFPTGGVRVFAYPAPHFAVADGSDAAHGFIYLNLRMARGRSAAVQRATGSALREAVAGHLAPLLARQRVGVTLQIDEGAEVFDAKLGNLHALFNAAKTS